MASVETAVSRRFDERLDALFASDPGAMAAASELFRELREAGAVHDHGPFTIVTRHADVKAIFRDADGFASGAKHRGTWADDVRARLDDEERRMLDEISRFEALQMVATGGEVHDRLRRIVHRAFTPRRIAQLETSAQQYLDEMVAELAGSGEGDLAPLAFRLPLMLVADLLGVPQADRDQVHAWSDVIGRNRGGTEAGPLRAAYAALASFRAYVEALVEEQRRSPASTHVIAAFMDAEADEQLSSEEIVSTYVMMLFAGHETTTNLIATGMLGLLQHPDQWRLLCDQPELAPDTTEELLRWVTPVQYSSRVAVVDSEIAGHAVPAGRTVRVFSAAANRDPAVFDDGDRVDIRRPNARDHLSLGFGLHFCLGASLARLEGTLAFATLSRSFPELALADDQLEWGGNATLRKLKKLPVTLGRPRQVGA